MTDTEFEAAFTNYGDPGCTQPTMKLEFGGHYKQSGPSDIVEGATKADLTVDSYTRITPLAEGVAGFLNSAGPGKCGAEAWSVSKRQDVKNVGCTVLGLAPNTEVHEYELLYARDDLLFFASRPVDGSSPDAPEKRPTTLQIPLRRVQ